MKYVLDTNVVSALMTEDARTIDRLERHRRDEIVVPQPVFAEIAYGIARLHRSKRRDVLTARFALLRGELPIAPWTTEVTDAFGQIKAALEREGRRIEDFDAAIAAHARALNAVLVTANSKHMARIPQLVIEDWSA